MKEEILQLTDELYEKLKYDYNCYADAQPSSDDYAGLILLENLASSAINDRLKNRISDVRYAAESGYPNDIKRMISIVKNELNHNISKEHRKIIEAVLKITDKWNIK